MRVNAASNGTHAVAVCELPSGIACLKYAPSSAGHWCNRQEFDALFLGVGLGQSTRLEIPGENLPTDRVGCDTAVGTVALAILECLFHPAILA